MAPQVALTRKLIRVYLTHSRCGRNQISQMCQIGENLVGVVGRVDLGIDRRNLPLLVNEIADALGITSLIIVAGSIGQRDLTVSIAQQPEGEVVLARERSVSRDIVETDAENDGAATFERIIVVAEPATFTGSPTRVSLGIEP